MTTYTASTLPAALAAAQNGDIFELAAGVHTFNQAIQMPPVNIKIVGPGSALTTVQLPTAPTVADVYGIAFDGVGTYELEGFTIEGPTTPSANGKYAFGIYVAGTSTAFDLKLTDIKISRPVGSSTTAGFYRAMMMVAGTNSDLGSRMVVAEDCDMTAANGVVNMYCNSSVTNQTFIARGTTFHSTSASHLLYIHPGISYSFTDCDFADCPNYALQHYSASAYVKARFANFKDCRFAADLTHGVLTSDQVDAMTEFYSCEFYNTAASNAAILARTSIRVWSSLLELGSQANGIQGVDQGTLEILGCTLRYTGLVAGGGALIAVTGGVANIGYCNFDLRSLDSSTPKAIWVVAASTTATAVVEDCHFHARLNVSTSSDAPIAVYVGAGGDASLDHCRFTGYFLAIYGAIHLNSATGTVDVDYCDFFIGPNLRPVYQTPAGATPGAVTWGSHNQLGSDVAQPSYVT